MNTAKIIWELRDNGGRRSGIDRRYFSYSDHIPERRNEKERRALEDRRAGVDRRNVGGVMNLVEEEQRMGADRRAAWN
jgi:hypothetical protein